MVTINDRDDLKRWLADKPRDWSVIIAARVAARVLPLIEGAADHIPNASRAIILPVFRAMAAPLVAAKYPTSGAEAYAAYAAAAAAAARLRLFQSFASDCARLETGVSVLDLAEQPLWQGGAPQWCHDHWSALRDRLRRSRDGFDVWIDFYESLFAPMPAAKSNSPTC